MSKAREEKGIILFIVLMTIFVVIILANVILNIMSSHSRLTHHQVSRIQAYYADWGGINYAYDKLRRGDDVNWPIPSATKPSYTHKICRAGCDAQGGDIINPDLPHTVKDATISVTLKGTQDPSGKVCTPPSDSIPVCISTTATYTYSQ